MTTREVKKENFIKIGAKQWFDLSQATLLAEYQAGNSKKEMAQLFKLPSGLFVARLWKYSDGGAWSDSGVYHEEWKLLQVKDYEFSALPGFHEPHSG